MVVAAASDAAIPNLVTDAMHVDAQSKHDDFANHTSLSAKRAPGSALPGILHIALYVTPSTRWKEGLTKATF